jgi:NAD(P)-dependent dehydrogenase (short-subunit alcohol dehydrogenase family)
LIPVTKYWPIYERMLSMNQRLKGQTAWISGGASGIGEATAKLFARTVAAEIAQQGGQAIFISCDVAQADQVQAAIEQTAAHFGGLHTIVNSAGVVHVGLLHETREQDWDALMGINLKSIFLAVKYGLPHLQQQSRSYVVNIASISGFVGQGGTPAYIASKSAVIGLTRAIALDYAAVGLRCNAVCPGITDTPMLRFHLSTTPDPEATLANRLRRVPMGVALQPLDVAKAARYFSCEDSAGITGTSLVVDAGYTATAEWETAGPTRFMEE